MTRDEALEIIKERYRKLPWPLSEVDLSDIATSDIDIWTKLGILKLDEPKTFNQKLCDGMKASLGVMLNFEEIKRVQESFDAAGLRIVEK